MLKLRAPLTDNSATVAKLKQGHTDLYRCLEFTVQAPGQWTMEDVNLNGGIFLEDGQDARMPPNMMDLENRLSGKRSFSVSRFGFFI